MFWFSFFAAVGWGILYFQTAFARTASLTPASLIGGLAFFTFLISFLVPPRFYRYTYQDVAPHVQTQVITRAAVGALLVLLLNGVVWGMLTRDIPLLEELYGYSLLAIFLFHGLAGAMASHVVYLQRTHQYNSNQLVAVIGAITLILLILVLYLVTMDWALPRDASIHLRDLMLTTLIFLVYGRAVYLMAHH
jgi:hypothetical protein